jgi:hypothetical protein
LQKGGSILPTRGAKFSEYLSNTLLRRISKSRKIKGYGVSKKFPTSVGEVKVRKYQMFEMHYLGANPAVIFVFIIIKLKIIQKEM